MRLARDESELRGQYWFIVWIGLILLAAGISVDDYLKEKKSKGAEIEQPRIRKIG
jgi:hypothetical protein